MGSHSSSADEDEDEDEDEERGVRVVNIVAKSHILEPFRLAPLIAHYSFDENESFLIRIPIRHNRTFFSIFRTGTVISRADRSLPEVEASFAWLRALLSEFELRLSTDYEILNVVAVSSCCPFSLNLLELVSHLPDCSYDPTPLLFNSHEHHVNCIVLHFDSLVRRRTALIFPTGKATLTGFKSVSDLRSCAIQLSALIAEIAQEHPEVLKGDRL